MRPVYRRVMPLKTLQAMPLNCPTCAIALSQRSLGGETVDFCNMCNGAWYDAAKLSTILRGTATLECTTRASSESPEAIGCPKCGNQITPTIYAHDSGIPILKCPSCSGVWLVQGQLEKLRQYGHGPHKTDRLGQAMAESYRQTNALNGIADLIQSRVLSTAFALAMLAVATILGVGMPGTLRLITFLALPMACIWFSDSMGNLTGIRMGLARPTISSSTPGIAVAFGGWILMFVAFGVMTYGMVAR